MKKIPPVVVIHWFIRRVIGKYPVQFSLIVLNVVFEISISSERRTTGYFLDACHNRLISSPYHVLNLILSNSRPVRRSGYLEHLNMSAHDLKYCRIAVLDEKLPGRLYMISLLCISIPCIFNVFKIANTQRYTRSWVCNTLLFSETFLVQWNEI
jgi:hypothetical protein